ncbi:MAG: type II secretory pathway component GspD/PulD (secretin)/tetratricopeptide (TPR) repeat protein [Pseudohongiellaceae bacterium]|jgi:type II secretory pathway component GspD/PulD (secretin)/tetratricopeptide (TPR) repeat protein
MTTTMTKNMSQPLRSTFGASPIMMAALIAVTFSCGSPAREVDAPPLDESALSDSGDVAQAIASSRANAISPFAGNMNAANAPLAPSLRDDEQVSEARRRADRVRDQLAVLVAGFTDQGFAALERSDIDEAHKQFGHAYELDPSNEVARDYYNRTGALLGEDTGSLGTLAADARTLARARTQQRSLDIQSKRAAGRSSMDAGDPEAALRAFEEALSLFRWDPTAGDNASSESELQALAAQAQQMIDEQSAARDAALIERTRVSQEEYENLQNHRTELKIKGLFDAANKHFMRDEFELAIERLDEGLLLSPLDHDLSDLRRIANRALTERVTEDVRKAYRKEWNRTFDDLEQDTIIPNNLIEFPDIADWAVIENRGPMKFGAGLTARPEGDQQVIDRLDDLAIPYAFDGNTLDEVLAHLKDVSGVNFLMSQDVQDEAFNQDYNLQDRNPQPLSRILRIILEDQSTPEMTYTVRDGIVRVITMDESRGDYILQMYDIRDLTFTPSDHSTVDFNLVPSGTDAESFQDGVEFKEPQPQISEDTLLTLIQDNISPDSWTDDPERSITQIKGTLIVKTTPEVHEQIEQMLIDLRKNTTTLIHIQTRFISVEDSFLQDIGVDLRGLSPSQGSSLNNFGQPNAGGVGTPNNPAGIGTGIDPGASYQGPNGTLKGRTENLFGSLLGEQGVLTNGGGLAIEGLFLDDVNVNAVLRAVSKYQTSNIVNAPSLTIRSGQRGNIKVLTNRTYVRDFEPEIATGAVIAQPDLGIVKDGIVLDVRAVASADRRFITLELRPTLAELVPGANGEPLPASLVSLGTSSGSNVTIQLPELNIQRLRTTATLPDGATLLLGGLKTSVEQDYKSDMPFFGDIPIISFFFTRQGDYVSKRKLLILLTANILAPEESEPNTSYLR